jgi:hypothetical protein
MRKMYIGIYGWARAGFRDCQLLAHIIGETRPYQIRRTSGFMVGRGRVLEIVNYWHILSVKPAPTKSAVHRDLWLGEGGF